DDGLLEAHIDFTSIRMETEEVAETDTAPLALEPSSPPKQYAPAVEAAPAPIDLSPPRLIALEDAGGRKRKYFCHKPWSDLHNFTVDGRMDVCCIATGPSQERYALGNLNTQNFQDVWNGATAKLFRRTVNSDKVLPPCARCPMGYQYHGMWFHREHTIGRVNGWLWSLGVFKPSYMKWLGRRVIDWARPTVSWLFFRNFK
ncbi:MAG: SPASM domain-containing protein, partial [Hyphomonadaceae bacterium]|nr:SPASM domain-containing protein [Hyphomonadaceae bacterium]